VGVVGGGGGGWVWERVCVCVCVVGQPEIAHVFTRCLESIQHIHIHSTRVPQLSLRQIHGIHTYIHTYSRVCQTNVKAKTDFQCSWSAQPGQPEVGASIVS
jgi:hypothetical protein